MKVIQGFVTSSSKISNLPGQVSDFMEISPMALTYSKNRAEYLSTSEIPRKTLHVFFTKDSITGTSFVLSEDKAERVFTAIKHVEDYFASQALNFSSSRFTAYVLAYCADFMQSFKHGNIFNSILPEWVSWVENDADATEVRIWLRNEAFESQFANYEITVIPPVQDLNDFFGQYASFSSVLKARTIHDFIEDVQVAKGEYPETYVRSLTMKFHNRNTAGTAAAQTTDFTWGFLIYGSAGDNIDTIKDALAEYLLSNTAHTEEEWKVILPEVFERTEFLLYPRWDLISVENSTSLSSLYRSAINLSEMTSYMLAHMVPDWTPAAAQSLIEVLPFDYKAITAGVLPGISNNETTKSLAELFPDYLPLSTSELDFNRMSIKTRNWVVLVVNAIVVAETASEYSSIQAPYRRVKRNDEIFVSFLYENINYLIRAAVNG